MDPQLRQTAKTFDAYKDRYSEAVDASVAFTGLSTDFFSKVKAEYIVDIAQRHFGELRRLAILDIGCGVGNYHPLMAPSFANLSGVDVSAACLATARGRNPKVQYKVYDGETLPYADASFDLAFTICVMHHVPSAQWQRFCDEMRRVLKPGGLALVFEHNPRNRLTLKAVNNCPFDADAELLRSEQTVTLLANAGFHSVSPRFILSVPAKGNFLRGLDKWFSRLPFGAQYYVSAVA